MKTKVSVRNIVLVVLIFAIALIALRLAIAPGVPVQYAAVPTRDVLVSILANGRIAGSRVVPLSMVRGGIVETIKASEGATVEPGDTLLTVESSDERNVVQRQKTALDVARVNIEKLSGSDLQKAGQQLAQAQSQEENAGARLERLRSLLAQGAVAQQEVDNARKEYDIAVSQVSIAQNAIDALLTTEQRMLQLQITQARTALREAEIGLARSILRAPVRGKVVRIHINRGQLVTPGLQVVSILPADTTTHVELQVDESEITRVRVGQRALVSIPSQPESTFEATVGDIVPIIDASRGTATVKLTLAALRDNLLPDLTVSAQVIIDTILSAFVVEQRFVSFARSEASVFVLRRGKAYNQPVRVRDAGGGLFVIDEGLAAGDTVLSAPSLRNGEKVSLSKKKEQS